jgi:hypothetical protein
LPKIQARQQNQCGNKNFQAPVSVYDFPTLHKTAENPPLSPNFGTLHLSKWF